MSIFPQTHSERIAPGSFQQPVPIPAHLPGVPDLVQVCFNRDWLPYILGCLFQLTLHTTWIADSDTQLNQVLGEANNLILIFQEALATCTVSNVGTAGAGDDFMLRQNPDNPCELQTSVDGVNWCTWADLSKCVTNKQPAQGSIQPPAGGGCTTYSGQVSIGDRWMLPNNVNAGDVIHVSHANGLWSTPLDLFLPRCPDGNLWFEIACVEGSGHTESGDPAPAINHDSLIATDGTNFYDCGPASDGMTVTITIPSGIHNANLFFLCNTPDTSGSGSVIFDVEYCNNATPSWTATLDFTSSPNGFVAQPDAGSTPQGVWVPGTGWQQSFLTDYGSGLCVRRLDIHRTGIPAFALTSMQCVYDFHPGTTIDPTAGQAFGSENGGAHFAFQDTTWGSPSGDNLFEGGAFAVSGQTQLFFDFYCGEAGCPTDPGGTVTLKRMILSGTGVNPFTGP